MNQTLSESACPDGGILRELYKDPGWGQINLRTIPAGKSKPGHTHHRRGEHWVLVRGENVWLTIEQPGSGPWTFHLPRWYPIAMDVGIGHAVANRGEEEAVIVFWMDEVYDPQDPDKYPWEPT
ncbi:MAG TPA: hypothetical protein VM537_20510 [Anaerolineae bacterium]|nr:hypothetical protein [Anaerolineae bacterium]